MTRSIWIVLAAALVACTPTAAPELAPDGSALDASAKDAGLPEGTHTLLDEAALAIEAGESLSPQDVRAIVEHKLGSAIVCPIPLTSCVSGILPIANGGTGVSTGAVTSVSGTAPISVSGTTTPTISLGTVGLANGGTGLTTATGLTTGNVLQATSGTTIGYGAVNLASSAAVTGVLPGANQGAQTLTGDASGTTSATVVWTAQSGTFNFASTGYLTVSATATSPGFSQLTPAVNVTPVTLTLAPQFANTSSTTTAAGTPGSLLVALGAPVSTGNEPAFGFTRGGVTYGTMQGCVGSGSTASCLYLYPGITPSASNFSLKNSSTATVYNAPTYLEFAVGGTVGAIQASNVFEVGTTAAGTNEGATNAFVIDNGTAPTSNVNYGVMLNSISGGLTVTPVGQTAAELTVSSTGLDTPGNLMIGSGTTSYGGGIGGVLSLQNVGTAATTANASGTIVQSTSSGLFAIGSGGTSTKIAPSGDAYSVNDAGTIVRLSAVGSGSTVGAAYTVPTGATCLVHAYVVGSASSGGAGAAEDATAVVRNSGGTAAFVAHGGSTTNPTYPATVGVSGEIADTAFGSTAAPIASVTVSGGQLKINVINNGASANNFEVFFQAQCSTG